MATSPKRRTTRQPLQATLQDVFGLHSLRVGQSEVIERVLAGRSTLAVMPTGAGKSLCYQLPAAMQDSCTLVVSPLIALMKDQCEKLVGLGIAAVQLNSHCSAEETRAAESAILDGSARVVLTTPERLAQPDFVTLLNQRQIALLVVDEAHCISQWGHDFRPAFLEVETAWRALGRPPVLALTATAPPAVAEEIMARLHIPADGCIDTGNFRPNLRYAVEHLESKQARMERLVDMVAHADGSGIVYAATVKVAEVVHAKLLSAGHAAGIYHGRRSATERREAQEAFMRGDVRVMVATNAFGMGIDKADIRFVVHCQMPSGLDAYYQESGRAGRDGDPAGCTLLFMSRDKSLQQFFMSGRYPDHQELQAVYGALAHPAAKAVPTATTLARALDLPRHKVQVAVQLLREHKVIAQDRRGVLRLLDAKLKASALRTMAAAYQTMRERDRAIVEQMVAYAQTGGCRWQALLSHLDEDTPPVGRCGTCDNCQRIASIERLAEPIVLPKEAQQPDRSFTPDQPVKVKRYGAGRVVSSDATSVTIEFDGGVQRCFHPSFVKATRRTPEQARLASLTPSPIPSSLKRSTPRRTSTRTPQAASPAAHPP